MIENVQVGSDGAEFPVVSWIEARRFAGREKIECRIMKTATGELYFVARGRVRLGTFEEGRPWQRLQGFAIKSAAELYQDQNEQVLSRHFANKNAVLGGLLHDGSRVLVATFRIGSPMHLNYADAPLAQLERLHGILSESFVHGGAVGLAMEWHCAVDDARVETYDPKRPGWPEERSKRRLELVWAWLVNLGLAVAVLGMTFFLVYLVLLLFGVVNV